MAKQWRRREQQSHDFLFWQIFIPSITFLSASSPAPYFREKNRSTEAFSICLHVTLPPPASVHIYLPTFLLVSRGPSLFIAPNPLLIKRYFFSIVCPFIFSCFITFFSLYWISSTTVQTVKYLWS